MKLTRKQRLLLRKKRISRARHKRRKLQRLKDNIVLYRNDPAKFAEDFTGVKLTPFQKILVNMEYKHKLMTVLRQSGYGHYSKTYLNTIDIYNKLVKDVE